MFELPRSVVATSASVIARFPDGATLLTEIERRRMQALAAPDLRNDFLAAHVLLRSLISEVQDRPIAEVSLHQVCPQCGGPHGRPGSPEAPELHLSLAHSGGFVAAMIAERPCGIDVEPFDTAAVPRSALHPDELAHVDTLPDSEARTTSLRLWVRKEALLKAGVGELDEFGQLAALDPRGFADDRAWMLEDIDAPQGAVAASALLEQHLVGPDRFEDG